MKTVKCPRCGKEILYGDSPFRPFCSERCKLIDLGHWISGDYRVPVVETEETEDAGAETPDES